MITRPTTRITAAETAGRARTTGPSKDTRANARRAKHGDEPDARDRGGQSDAERDDQRHAEADPVQRDRRKQHDERGWARQQACRDTDAEDPLRGQRVVVIVLVIVVVSVTMVVVVVVVIA